MDIAKITTGVQIGEYGYSHWSGKSINNQHDPCFIPQSIYDGWECYCSCGNWKAFVNSRDTPTREMTFTILREAHAKHIERPSGYTGLLH